MDAPLLPDDQWQNWEAYIAHWSSKTPYGAYFEKKHGGTKYLPIRPSATKWNVDPEEPFVGDIKDEKAK